jgi:hypothetical protein
MSITIKKYWHWMLFGVLILLGVMEYTSVALGAPPVFLTRLASTTTTYPRNARFSVGTTTPLSAKFSVYANRGETMTKLLQVASSTATTQGDLFLINNVGCVQVIATSTLTPVKLTFNATTTHGATNNGVVDWAYGTCP